MCYFRVMSVNNDRRVGRKMRSSMSVVVYGFLELVIRGDCMAICGTGAGVNCDDGVLTASRWMLVQLRYVMFC